VQEMQELFLYVHRASLVWGSFEGPGSAAAVVPLVVGRLPLVERADGRGGQHRAELHAGLPLLDGRKPAPHGGGELPKGELQPRGPLSSQLVTKGCGRLPVSRRYALVTIRLAPSVLRRRDRFALN
jgi:hypothetical protein